MITDYMEDLEITNPFSHLKPWQKTPYEKQHGRNIYKNNNGKYFIEKRKNNVRTHYGTYDTFQEALEARDELIRNGWVKDEIVSLEQKTKKYYRNVSKDRTHYHIAKGNKFYGCTQTVEEALYYRDICIEHNWQYDKRPYELDLKTGNPYLEDGLEYPLPERLIMPPKAPKRKGSITRNSAQSNRVHLGKSYFGSYPTFEMAYYVREKLNECNWDKTQLDRIVDEYPVWYTWLMNLYKFVFPKYNGWCVSITPKHSKDDKLEHLYFRRLEDALWERDLLVKYDWNEELVCECANDLENPYYDMELPPYPERKIRNLSDRKDRTELFDTLFTLIQDEPNLSQEDYAKLAGTTGMNIRNILVKEYDSSWSEFKRVCESGEHPNEVLTQKPKIYQPDTSIHYKNTNYVSYHKREKSPYLIYHRNKETGQSEYFGAYPSRELANKISNDLQKCGWDKSQLKRIQAKHGWQSVVNSKKWVYPHYYTSKRTGEKYVSHYMVRKKNIGYFGTYKDKRVADLVRDCCIMNEWDKDKFPMVKKFAYEVIDREGDYEGYQGYRLWGLSFL